MSKRHRAGTGRPSYSELFEQTRTKVSQVQIALPSNLTIRESYVFEDGKGYESLWEETYGPDTTPR